MALGLTPGHGRPGRFSAPQPGHTRPSAGMASGKPETDRV
jgi:hypothetical protein